MKDDPHFKKKYFQKIIETKIPNYMYTRPNDNNAHVLDYHFNGLTSVSDKNGDHETVNGDDTGHDDWDDRLHDKIRSHDAHSGNTGTTLCRTISCS